MTRELQSTVEASGIIWPEMRNHILCMVNVIQRVLGGFMNNLGGNGRTMSSEAHECDWQLEENASTDIGKSQRLQKEGNGRIQKVSAM